MSTPHIQAEIGEVAKTVIMPGDPLRAKFIADTFLESAKQFNSVRNMFGYTGFYKGKEVSVMGSGMGMPSIGIYSYELYTNYGVDDIIRVGSAGSYCKEAKIYDVILADSAYSESSFALTQSGYPENINYPSSSLNDELIACAKLLDIPLRKGRIHSSDVFYREDQMPYYKNLYKEKGCLAVEMESFGLFHNANILGKRAACLVTISDSFVSNEVTTSEERQNSFTNMMKIALEVNFIG